MSLINLNLVPPAKGSAEYERQAEEARATFALLAPVDQTEEDDVIAALAIDSGLSANAIMDGMGRWKVQARATSSGSGDL